jgi:cell division protein FtsN
MSDRFAESGLELVLDNKKLIVAFLVLITICGCAYVLGFIEGKRQGSREGNQNASVVVSTNNDAAPPNPAANDPENNKPAEKVEQPMDLGKNINQPEGESQVESPATSPEKKPQEAKLKEDKSTEKKPKVQALPGASLSYTVQVGAFRQKHEAETKAQLLKSKGYDYRIEHPISPGQLYLLKVGKFTSRADAVALQIRLKKNGFSCFVKTNELP